MSVFLTKPLLKENHQSRSQSGEIVLNQILGACQEDKLFIATIGDAFCTTDETCVAPLLTLGGKIHHPCL